MATTDLSFSRNPAGRYEASFVSEGPTVIQMERTEKGSISIYANLEGMEKKYIGGYGNYEKGDYKNMVFMVDTLPGMTVTVESSSEVVSAKMSSGSESIKDLLSSYTRSSMEGVQPGEESLLCNVRDGSSMKYVGMDKTGFVGVSNGSTDDVWAEMGCGDSNTKVGSRLLAKTTGIYYTKKEGTDTGSDDEILTKGDLNELRMKINELEKRLSMLQNSLQSPLISLKA